MLFFEAGLSDMAGFKVLVGKMCALEWEYARKSVYLPCWVDFARKFCFAGKAIHFLETHACI